MTGAKLPRWLEAAAARLLRRHAEGPVILGDLQEGWAYRMAQRGRASADFWYVRQLASLVIHRRGVMLPTTASTSRVTASGVEVLLDGFAQALRAVRRRPGFTVGVCGVLAIAMAGTMAAYSVLSGTRDAARWWADEDRSVLVWPEYAFSRGQLDVLRQETQAFSAIGGYVRSPAVIARADRLASSPGVAISPELFQALRAKPLYGRGLLEEDAVSGAEPVAVIGHRLWTSTFAGDPSVIGQVVEVSGVNRRIVGVMPPGAGEPGPASGIWTPLSLDPRDPDFWPARELTVAAIVRPGVPLGEARDDVRAALGGLARRFPFFFPPDFGSDATVVLSADISWKAVSTPLLLLLAGTLLLLVVAAIDVGNLVLARSLARATELRVRVAVGASRGRVVQQLLTEAAVHAAVATVIGWLLGSLLARRLPALFPFGTPVQALSPTDPAVLGYVAVIAVAAWALMGVIPTVHFLGIWSRSLAARRGGPVAAHGLVVAQAALATTLLVAAALLLRTVQQLDRLPLGFEPDRAVSVPVAASVVPRSPGALDNLRTVVARRVTADPALEIAGWISAVPLHDVALTAPVNKEESPVEVAAAPLAARFVADSAAMAALGMRIVQGRGLTGLDLAGTPPVVLINETLARTLWPDRDPVGRRIAVDPHGWSNWITVVGVVADARFEDLTFPVSPAFFLPRGQAWTPAMSVVARTSGDPSAIVPTVRAALAELAPDVPAGEARALAAIVRDAQGPARVLTTLLVGLALLATALGAIGLYGALAGWVARRQTEIGTRLALGASPARLSAGVLLTGFALTAAGVLAGAVGGAIIGRMIRTLLFGVSPLDPMAFLLPALLLLVTGVVAAAVPARRAATVAPQEALRAG